MTSTLSATAAELVGAGRGILAADESVGTMDLRLKGVEAAPGVDNRVAYREMLLTTPGLSDWVGGIILSDDIFTAHLSGGRSTPEVCRASGLLAGIKVDTGARPLAAAPGETVTEGLDGLRPRMEAYAAAGAAFTKWRAVITIADGRPSRRALRANAHALARYAALAQEAGLVPIVEPEVLMDGDHTLARCAEVTELTLGMVFDELVIQGVLLEGIVLKPNMVVPGMGCAVQAGVDEVAAVTIRTLRRTVPPAVPGIAFLSGGQGPEKATAHLAAMTDAGPQPWELSFSFGRALVDPALRAWAGSPGRIAAGQEALAARCRANFEARVSTRLQSA